MTTEKDWSNHVSPICKRCGERQTLDIYRDNEGNITSVTEGCRKCNYAHVLKAPGGFWKALG